MPIRRVKIRARGGTVSHEGIILRIGGGLGTVTYEIVMGVRTYLDVEIRLNKVSDSSIVFVALVRFVEASYEAI